MTGIRSTLPIPCHPIGPVAVPLPVRQTAGSAGLDLRAAISAPLTIAPGERAKVPTGLAFAIPFGHEGQVRSRSGLAAKHGVLAAPGTVDSDYRGEVCVVLFNHGADPFVVNPLDRIAQIVFAKHDVVDLVEVDTLDETERGANGFGSSGVK